MTAVPVPPHLSRLLDQVADVDGELAARLFAAATLRAELDITMTELEAAAKAAGMDWLTVDMAVATTATNVGRERAEHPPSTRETTQDAEAFELRTDEDRPIPS